MYGTSPLPASAAIGLLASLLTLPAAAQAPPTTTPPTATPPVAPSERAAPRGDYVHDGLYVRLAMGPGYQAFQQTVRVPGGQTKTNMGGLGIDGHAMLGWTVPPGLVLGLGLSTLVLPGGQRIRREPGFNPGSGQFATEPEVIGTTRTWTRATILGAALDLYPDPTQGLHLQGMIGYASLGSLQGAGLVQSYAGVGLSAGVGGEWWLAPRWSAGLLGNVQLLGLTGEGSGGNGNNDISATMIALSLLGTITFH